MATRSSKVSDLLKGVFLKNLYNALNDLRNESDEQGTVSVNAVKKRLEAAYDQARLSGQIFKAGYYSVFPTDFYDQQTHKRLYCCMKPHTPPADKPEQTMILHGYFPLGEGPLMNQKPFPGVSDKRSILEIFKRAFRPAA